MGRFLTAGLFAAAMFSMTPAAEASAIRSGFADIPFPGNDDGSVGPVGIFAANFFGTTYTSLYVNNNGNVTFTGPLSTFTPSGLTTNPFPIIAPFWADVDTGGASADVTYGTDTVGGNAAFAVNWINVGYYSQQIDKLNSFQLVLIDRSDIGAGNFDIEFNYDKIQWETGQASGSSNGLGGSSARVGYTDGGANDVEFFGSGVNGYFLDSNFVTGLIYDNNVPENVDGRYRFNVRNGDVTPETPVPEPTSLALMGIGGLGMLIGGIRRRRVAV